MKNYAKLIKLTLLVVSSAIMFSCSDDDSSTQDRTITEFLSKNPTFTNLYAALEKAELSETLNQSGQFTIFAPTNEAFAEFLAVNGFENLEAVPTPVLKEILLNHVLNARVPSSDVSTGYVKTLAKGSASSTNTLSMFINVSESGVRINGVSSVTAFDINASNGVVHVVDAVIGLPTIVTHALANPNFSNLVGALTSPGQPDFVGILSGNTNSPFTVFAPSNAAFSRFETQNPGTLGSLTSGQLTSVLTYHVVAGANVLSTGIPSGPITTFETGTFTVNGTTITDEAGRQTNIVAVDVQAANGVIHVLDNIILPNLN